jgi:hypothetical protein
LFVFDWGLALNIARLVGIIFIYNKTQSADLEYVSRLALAMKRQVEEEDIHTIHTIAFEARRLCARKLGQGARCKMHQLRLKYKIRLSISISDFSYYKKTKFHLHFFFRFLSKNCSFTADVILSGQQADKFYFFIYLAHRRAELNCFDIRAPLPKKAGGAGAAETMRALTSSRESNTK